MARAQTYPSLGRCIYCGDDTRRLTDEHIIPDALGGRLVFLKASCPLCQRQIESFEGRLLNGQFGPARALLQIRSGKKSKPRQKLRVMKHITAEQGEIVYTRADDHPGNLFLHGLQPPRFIGGPNQQGYTIVTKNLKENPWVPSEHMEMFAPADTYLDFTRLLAKIAHAYWVAEHPNADLHPVLPEFIKGTSEGEHDVFIGENPEMKTAGDDLHTLHAGTLPHQGFQYGFVDIALFARFPVYNGYRVYVGSVGEEMKFTIGGEQPPDSLHGYAAVVR